MDGVKSYYWDGANDPNDHTCACGATDSCVTSFVSCNCDSSAPQWLSDEGNLTDMSALPVKELNFGGLIFDGQEAKFELGPLSCSGREVPQLIVLLSFTAIP